MKLGPQILFAVAVSGLPAWSQVTTRVSISSGGQEGYASSSGGRITPDGRFVVFDSVAQNLVLGDTNGAGDVFVRDRILGTTERVSLTNSGLQANDNCNAAGISDDGRFVVIVTPASNLVAGDSNGINDVFVRDRQAGTTARVSISSGGAQGNGMSGSASCSADCRYVAFNSWASSLVAGDTNAFPDVFVRDRVNGTTERVSVSSAGIQGNDGSYESSISADGRVVTFSSYATNLVAGDTNGQFDIFARDRIAGTTVRVSVDSQGAQSNGSSLWCSISADGRFVTFQSTASNLVPADTNAFVDLFVHDLLSGTTERVNVDSSGAQANSPCGYAKLSADGRFVVFDGFASNLVPGDSNSLKDVFVHDRLTGSTGLVSVDSAGVQGNGTSNYPSISNDGRYVVFSGWATNLVPLDGNFYEDVFVRDLHASGFASLCEPGGGGVIACPCGNPPAGAGRGCDNLSATGGASLAASGVAYLASDTLQFTTADENPTSTSLLVQGAFPIAIGVTFGRGVRCVGGTLRRLFQRTALNGSIRAPGAGDPSISARSAQLGDPIQPGATRWYLVYYRDPLVSGGCPSSSTFNSTQTASIEWWP